MHPTPKACTPYFQGWALALLVTPPGANLFPSCAAALTLGLLQAGNWAALLSPEPGRDTPFMGAQSLAGTPPSWGDRAPGDPSACTDGDRPKLQLPAPAHRAVWSPWARAGPGRFYPRDSTGAAPRLLIWALDGGRRRSVRRGLTGGPDPTCAAEVRPPCCPSCSGVNSGARETVGAGVGEPTFLGPAPFPQGRATPPRAAPSPPTPSPRCSSGGEGAAVRHRPRA